MGPLQQTPLEKVLLRELCEIASDTYDRGWNSGTSGNFSIVRQDRSIAWLSPSGVGKGSMLAEQFVPVCCLSADALTVLRKPSDEAPLHAAIYRRFANAKAVIHVHTPAIVKWSMRSYEQDFIGHEMQKAFGLKDHKSKLKILVIDNNQNMYELAMRLPSVVKDDDRVIVLRGHGVYSWAKDSQSCLAQVEALDFLCKQYE
jgi:methylthioribulose-1-phosphate dehydratase